MMNPEFRLKYILVGASGSGKSTMASILEEQLGLKRCISCTTRPPRPGEVNGVHYHFKNHIDTNDMFEHASFGGFEYGISREELTQGDFIILEPQGVSYYRQHYPAPLTVIQLVREGIHVDADRMARDRDAGFDQVNPDIIVRGETIAEMASRLIACIQENKNCHFQKREDNTLNAFEKPFFEDKLRDAIELAGPSFHAQNARMIPTELHR